MPYAKLSISTLGWSKKNKNFKKGKNKVFEFDYEELVEIFGEFRDKEHQQRFHGNEAHDSAMIKAEKVFEALPVTDY